jgi:hypothetical protein
MPMTQKHCKEQDVQIFHCCALVTLAFSFVALGGGGGVCEGLASLGTILLPFSSDSNDEVLFSVSGFSCKLSLGLSCFDCGESGRGVHSGSVNISDVG